MVRRIVILILLIIAVFFAWLSKSENKPKPHPAKPVNQKLLKEGPLIKPSMIDALRKFKGAKQSFTLPPQKVLSSSLAPALKFNPKMMKVLSEFPLIMPDHFCGLENLPQLQAAAMARMRAAQEKTPIFELELEMTIAEEWSFQSSGAVLSTPTFPSYLLLDKVGSERLPPINCELIQNQAKPGCSGW